MNQFRGRQGALHEPGFATRAIHAGYEPDPRTGAINVPVYASSTFAQTEVGVRGDYEYARKANPTRAALEANLAALERGAHGRAFGSGMAAIDAALRALLRPGDHLVLPNDVYGGTFRLVDKILGRWGVTYSTVEAGDVDAVRAGITSRTKVVWLETPSNPLLDVSDIEAIAGVTAEAGVRLVVDNTFASPYLQQPLALGADVVVHSTTKYLGGHSDVLGGALVTDDEELDEDFGLVQTGAGGVPSPFDAFLTLRGIKTLAVRMEQHCTNAEAVVEALQAHPAVASVRYPGLAGHPGHEAAARQMRRFGGMVALRLAGGRQAAVDLCARTGIFTLAGSLGGTESLIEHPATMTHAASVGSAVAVPEDLVRLSVGIEDTADLLADLDQALG